MQPNWLDPIRKMLRGAVMVVTWIAAAALCIMVLVIVINVIGRYLFKLPLQGSGEVVELALVVTVFFSLAYTELRKGHVSMDEVVARFSRRGRAIVMSIMYFAAGAFFFIMGWRDWVLAVSYAIPAMRVTDVLKIPIAPFIFIVAVGAVIFGLELLMNGFSPLSSGDDNKDEVK